MSPAFDIVDLKGKVVIVTGGKSVSAEGPLSVILTVTSSSSIGYGTVRHLARAAARVYMAARNENRAAEAIERLKTESLEPGNGEVLWLKLDLSDPRLARQSAEEFMRKEKRLDVLGELFFLLPSLASLALIPNTVNNAGV